jgi:hypothetical protein
VTGSSAIHAMVGYCRNASTFVRANRHHICHGPFPNVVISKQRQEVSNLMANIAASLDIRSTVDVALINEIDPTTIIQQYGWIVTKDVVVMHICNQGSWAHDLYNELSDIEK